MERQECRVKGGKGRRTEIELWKPFFFFSLSGCLCVHPLRPVHELLGCNHNKSRWMEIVKE